MSSSSKLAPEEREPPRAVPTSASKCLSSSWRKSKGSLDLLSAGPRYLQDFSWRRREPTATSLPSSPDQSPNLPLYKRDSRIPTSALTSPWIRSDSKSLHQNSCSPWNKTASNIVDQVTRLPSWRTEMLPNVCKSSLAPMPNGSDLTRGAEADEGEVRPRLQLQIPAGGEGNFDSPQIALRSGDSSHSHTAAALSVPQQASQSSNKLSIDVDPRNLAENLNAEMRLSTTSDSNVAQEQHGGIPRLTDDDFPSLSDPGGQNSRTDIANRTEDEAQTSLQNLTSSSTMISQLSSPREPPTTIAGRTGLSTHTHHFSVAAQGISLEDPFLAGRGGQAHNAHQADRALPPHGPRFIGRRPGYAHNAVRGGPARRPFMNHMREATHSNSRTWVHPRTRLQAMWADVYRNLKDMSIIKEGQESPSGAIVIVGGGSFCVPRTFNDWVEHRTEFANDRAKEARRRLHAAREHKITPRHADLPPAGEIAPITIMPFMGKKFRDSRASVLASCTIWTHWKMENQGPPEEERPEAPWPSYEEMKEEGNERNTSQYRRFLALPREPCNDTVNWKQRKAIPMLPFDEVWKLPSRDTYHDQRAVTSPPEMKKMESMVGQDLLSEIDCKTSDSQDEG